MIGGVGFHVHLAHPPSKRRAFIWCKGMLLLLLTSPEPSNKSESVVPKPSGACWPLVMPVLDDVKASSHAVVANVVSSSLNDEYVRVNFPFKATDPDQANSMKQLTVWENIDFMLVSHCDCNLRAPSSVSYFA